MGGHAAAFTNPPDLSSRSGGISEHAIFDETHADALHTIAASTVSAFTHSGHVCDDALNFVPESGAQAQQSSTATTSIFDRSATLCNSLLTKPLVDHGARPRRAGKTATQQRSASAPCFDRLSAQALACEITHGKVCHNMPAGPQALPLHAVHHATIDEAAPFAHHAPGWVLEAPQGEQPGQVSDVLFAPGATDCKTVEQHDSGHSGRNKGSMLNSFANSSFTGDSTISFGASSDMVPGWVPGAPPQKGAA